MQYGLIGAVLKHSFSKEIHERYGRYSYELKELADDAAFNEFMAAHDFAAINVTIPYKERVIPYCALLSPRAKSIGAVNTILNTPDGLYGDNTDFYGFETMAQSIGAEFKGSIVMILGTGGTQKTAAAVAEAHGALEIIRVSRKAGISTICYQGALKRTDIDILINTSPVGMYPNNSSIPIDITAFPRLRAVLDVVYNPLETRLVAKARLAHIPAANGLVMLAAQASLAYELFCGEAAPANAVSEGVLQIRRQMCNIVLIGMPSCGKSTLAQLLSQQLAKPLIDIDEEISKKANMPIADIFAQHGEAEFRTQEAQCIAQAAAQTGRVIATGGGAVLCSENIDALRQNGIVIYIDRPIKDLATGGARPLSTDTQALQAMYTQRHPLYTAAAHAVVCNTSSINNAILHIKEKIDEVLNNKWA